MLIFSPTELEKQILVLAQKPVGFIYSAGLTIYRAINIITFLLNLLILPSWVLSQKSQELTMLITLDPLAYMHLSFIRLSLK